MRVKDFCNFIEARERYRTARELRHPRYADTHPKLVLKNQRNRDPIIEEYRFCNVRRNDDRVTRYVQNQFMQDFRTSPEAWFAITMARLFNNVDTLATLQHAEVVLPFNPTAAIGVLRARETLGLRVFNPAYIVSTNGRKIDKIEYVINHVLKPMWRDKAKISRAIIDASDLDEVHKILQAQNGLGSFMAAQVVADLKYINPNSWPDFHTFAASGPGSKRGLNRVFERDVKAPLSEREFRDKLTLLRERTNARLKMEPITAQDIQNCLCEFDKYERVRLGEGKPKQKYSLNKEPMP
tara:strand:- start:1495 stop:2382 length:888 start_codon:yes stop_codon:yes gene_type:complete